MATKRATKRRTAKRATTSVVAPVAPPLVDMGRTTALKVVKSTAEEIEYTLSDGAVFKIRPILMSIERSLNMYNPNGEPMYQAQTGLAVHVSVPKRLKRKVTK